MNKRRDDEPSAIFSRGGRARSVPGRASSAGPTGRGPADFSPSQGDDDFRPPNPKSPVAGAKPGVVVGAVMMILGIIALVVFPFLPVSFPGWTTGALIGVIILGIVILFGQMPSRRAGTDDGARL